MKPVFRAEIVDINLDLFVEHYDRAITFKWNAGRLLGDLPEDYQFITNEDEWPDIESTYVVHVEKKPLWFATESYLPLGRYSQARPQEGFPPYATGVWYTVHTAGKVGDDSGNVQPLIRLFMLFVSRYHLTRVNLLLEEFDRSFQYASLFKSWLTERWGGEVKGMQMPELPDASPSDANDLPSPERGPNFGTLGRVAEAHRLMTVDKMGKVDACRRANTDPRTYAHRCKEATGEDPL